MSTEADPRDVDGPAAPPRANGELVFTAPWQSRVFGATMRLREGGQIDWDRFRDGLIAEIDRHERELADEPDRSLDDDYDYWGCWQRALERQLDEIGLLPGPELADRSAELADRPAGHDHRHDHHDHHHDR